MNIKKYSILSCIDKVNVHCTIMNEENIKREYSLVTKAKQSNYVFPFAVITVDWNTKRTGGRDVNKICKISNLNWFVFLKGRQKEEKSIN